MGTYPKGQKVARGASDLSSIFDDDITFGKEWQVHNTETLLFHDRGLGGVQYPTECTMPTLTHAATMLRLGEGGITMADAELASARVGDDDRDTCVFDVLATSDKDMAGSY